MIELTQQQRLELSATEPAAIDPETREVFILVRREQYQYMKALLADTLDIREAYPLLDEMAAKSGWNDPAMDIYNDFARKS